MIFPQHGFPTLPPRNFIVKRGEDWRHGVCVRREALQHEGISLCVVKRFLQRDLVPDALVFQTLAGVFLDQHIAAAEFLRLLCRILGFALPLPVAAAIRIILLASSGWAAIDGISKLCPELARKLRKEDPSYV